MWWLEMCNCLFAHPLVAAGVRPTTKSTITDNSTLTSLGELGYA